MLVRRGVPPDCRVEIWISEIIIMRATADTRCERVKIGGKLGHHLLVAARGACEAGARVLNEAHVWRGVDGREELGDAHAQVAMHPVRHHFAAVVVELDVGEIVLRAVVLDGVRVRLMVRARVRVRVGRG